MDEINYNIEIATTDFSTTQAAISGGAGRIELCAALTEGGTTPSFGIIKQCRESFSIALFPIIRARSGDFLYTEEEFHIMKQDALLCKQIGCEGVVLGFLKRDGTINLEWTQAIIDLVYPLEVTFHRAFDRCRDPFEALENLVQIGCTRILTSGQKRTAPEGAEMIKQLVQASDGRIGIMPGSGVRKENIKELAERTGATEFHSSLRSKERSSMEFMHPAFEGSEESYINPAVSINEVEALRKALL